MKIDSRLGGWGVLSAPRNHRYTVMLCVTIHDTQLRVTRVTTPRPSKHRQAGSEWILSTTTPQSCHKLGIANTAYQRVREPCLSTMHFISIHASCTGEDGTTVSHHYSRHESKYITTLERAKDIQITRKSHMTQQYI